FNTPGGSLMSVEGGGCLVSSEGRPDAVGRPRSMASRLSSSSTGPSADSPAIRCARARRSRASAAQNAAVTCAAASDDTSARPPPPPPQPPPGAPPPRPAGAPGGGPRPGPPRPSAEVFPDRLREVEDVGQDRKEQHQNEHARGKTDDLPHEREFLKGVS